jgi:hypothetical protein
VSIPRREFFIAFICDHCGGCQEPGLPHAGRRARGPVGRFLVNQFRRSGASTPPRRNSKLHFFRGYFQKLSKFIKSRGPRMGVAGVMCFRQQELNEPIIGYQIINRSSLSMLLSSYSFSSDSTPFRAPRPADFLRIPLVCCRAFHNVFNQLYSDEGFCSISLEVASCGWWCCHSNPSPNRGSERKRGRD